MDQNGALNDDVGEEKYKFEAAIGERELLELLVPTFSTRSTTVKCAFQIIGIYFLVFWRVIGRCPIRAAHVMRKKRKEIIISILIY
jgi:hypothetical protein